jgi:hypothetical protein
MITIFESFSVTDPSPTELPYATNRPLPKNIFFRQNEKEFQGGFITLTVSSKQRYDQEVTWTMKVGSDYSIIVEGANTGLPRYVIGVDSDNNTKLFDDYFYKQFRGVSERFIGEEKYIDVTITYRLIRAY